MKFGESCYVPQRRNGSLGSMRWGGGLQYLPISSTAMRRAAELWAGARQKGQSTADDRSIDADVILAAQTLMVGAEDVIIATTNVGHLSRFTAAALLTELPATLRLDSSCMRPLETGERARSSPFGLAGVVVRGPDGEPTSERLHHTLNGSPTPVAKPGNTSFTKVSSAPNSRPEVMA